MEEEYLLEKIMKKNKETNKSLNNIILRLNNSSFMLILIAYLGILLTLVIVLTPKKDFLYVPNYEHNYYAEEIMPQLTLVALRTKNTADDTISLRYNVAPKIIGRLNDKGIDPKLKIDRFQMSTHLSNNKMYYFTEQVDRTTPITHTYFLQSTATEQNIPETFYFKINYTDANGEKKIGSFKEDIMVELPKGTYTTKNNITHTDADNKDIEDVDVNFIAKKEENRYLLSGAINVEDLTKKYHIDMQTWIVTEDGEVLPFMGVYGLANASNNIFRIDNREVIDELKPKELYCHLIYTITNENGSKTTEVIQYKETFDNLPSKYGETPEDNNVVQPTTPEFNWIPWLVGAAIVVVGALSTTYYITKKRKKEDKAA